MAVEKLRHFHLFIIFQSFVCINRSYILAGFKKTITNVNFFISCLLVLGVTIFDCFTEMSILLRAFQLFLFVELVFIAIITRFQAKSIESMQRVILMFSYDEEIVNKLSRKVKGTLLMGVLSLSLDASGIKLVTDPTVMYTMWVSSAAHISEMVFYSNLLGEINERLAKLRAVDPIFESRAYRQFVIIISQINEDFELQIFVILAVTLITTTIYAVMITLSNDVSTMMLYLIWRQFKSIYGLLKMCTEAARTETLCADFTFHLAKKLVNEAKNSPHRKIIHRLLSATTDVRPTYSGFATVVINLKIPVYLLNVSANYLLIIVQIYSAYSSKV